MAMPVKVSEAQIQGAKTVRRKVVRMPTWTLRKGWSGSLQQQHDVVGARRPEEGANGGEDAAMQQALIVLALGQLDIVLGGIGAQQRPAIAVGDGYVVDGG